MTNLSLLFILCSHAIKVEEISKTINCNSEQELEPINLRGNASPSLASKYKQKIPSKSEFLKERCDSPDGQLRTKKETHPSQKHKRNLTREFEKINYLNKGTIKTKFLDSKVLKEPSVISEGNFTSLILQTQMNETLDPFTQDMRDVHSKDSLFDQLSGAVTNKQFSITKMKGFSRDIPLSPGILTNENNSSRQNPKLSSSELPNKPKRIAEKEKTVAQPHDISQMTHLSLDLKQTRSKKPVYCATSHFEQLKITENPHVDTVLQALSACYDYDLINMHLKTSDQSIKLLDCFLKVIKITTREIIKKKYPYILHMTKTTESIKKKLHFFMEFRQFYSIVKNERDPIVLIHEVFNILMYNQDPFRFICEGLMGNYCSSCYKLLQKNVSDGILFDSLNKITTEYIADNNMIEPNCRNMTETEIELHRKKIFEETLDKSKNFVSKLVIVTNNSHSVMNKESKRLEMPLRCRMKLKCGHFISLNLRSCIFQWNTTSFSLINRDDKWFHVENSHARLIQNPNEYINKYEKFFKLAFYKRNDEKISKSHPKSRLKTPQATQHISSGLPINKFMKSLIEANSSEFHRNMTEVLLKENSAGIVQKFSSIPVNVDHLEDDKQNSLASIKKEISSVDTKVSANSTKTDLVTKNEGIRSTNSRKSTLKDSESNIMPSNYKKIKDDPLIDEDPAVNAVLRAIRSCNSIMNFLDQVLTKNLPAFKIIQNVLLTIEQKQIDDTRADPILTELATAMKDQDKKKFIQLLDTYKIDSEYAITHKKSIIISQKVLGVISEALRSYYGENIDLPFDHYIYAGDLSQSSDDAAEPRARKEFFFNVQMQNVSLTQTVEKLIICNPRLTEYNEIYTPESSFLEHEHIDNKLCSLMPIVLIIHLRKSLEYCLTEQAKKPICDMKMVFNPKCGNRKTYEMRSCVFERQNTLYSLSFHKGDWIETKDSKTRTIGDPEDYIRINESWISLCFYERKNDKDCA